MKLLTFYLLFLPFFAQAQQEKIQRIIFKYYENVEFRNDTLRGIRAVADSVIYIKDDKYLSFNRDSVTHIEQIYRPFAADKRFILNQKVTINDYAMSLPSIWVNDLEYLLDSSTYVRRTWVKKNGSNLEPQAEWIPTDYSLKYYDVDTTFFDCLCRFYESKLPAIDSFDYAIGHSYKKCSDPVDFQAFLSQLIDAERSLFIYSSHQTFFIIKIEYQTYFLKMFIANPNNTKQTAWQLK